MTELAQNSQMAEGEGPFYMGKESMRLCAKDPDIQTFQEECLVPLRCPDNSVQGLCDFLSETLGQLGETRRIHPNRLHTLLSNDVSKASPGDIQINRAGRQNDPVRQGYSAGSRECTSTLQGLGGCRGLPE
jgi:hypothetical protein